MTTPLESIESISGRIENLCGVVLAAGAGTRLAPLTNFHPKPLCPVNNEPLLERAFAELAELGLAGPANVAVNAWHLAEQVEAAVAGRAHISRESHPLGTAGAIGALRDWIAGRDAVIVNGDTYRSGDGLRRSLLGWSRERARVLAVDSEEHSASRRYFGRWSFAGLSLLPWRHAKQLAPTPSGLYEVVWRAAYGQRQLEFAPFDGVYLDCGKPSDYLAANLHAADAAMVIGAGARVEGRALHSVVWPGGVVGRDEDLVEVIRIGDSITVTAPQLRHRTKRRRSGEGA